MSVGVMKAYLKMILDGTAFSNWESKPDEIKRNKIIDYILEGKSFNSYLNLRKATIRSRNEEELKSMIDEMSIKEEEFMI